MNTPALGRALAKTLGPHQALIIRAHGEVVVAETLPALLMDCIHFTENAEALYHASLLGRVVALTPDELERFGQSLEEAQTLGQIVDLLHWPRLGRWHSAERLGKRP